MITTDELVKKVRLLLNEPDEDIQLSILSEDTRRLSDTIKGLLRDAVFFVQHNKTYGALNPVSLSSVEVQLVDNGDGSGSVLLPDDFVSLIELKMEGWERGCNMLLPKSSPLALAQTNINTRGGVCKPVCVEGVDAEGRPVAVYYSLPLGVQPLVESFVYEAVFDEEKGLAASASNPLVMAVAYECAGLVYNIFERYDAANAFINIALSWCKKDND